jgi:D-aminoacyl-tRNA deacylase
MRAVIQRVSRAAVSVEGVETARIDRGLLILLGVGPQDDEGDVTWLAGKIARMRIFPDDDGKMNRSIVDCDGGVIVVSQFTLFAETAKGNRPSFTASAAPALAIPLYERFVAQLAIDAKRPVGTGRFGADMAVDLCNDGPVTIVMDSRQRE